MWDEERLEVYLISSDHLEDNIWFRDEDDFKAAMNVVAVTAIKTGVSILSFILMSNHVHFVVCSSMDTAKVFIDEFKRRYSMVYSRKWGTSGLLRRNDTDIRSVPINEGEALQRAIAYVQMNPVAARICLHPVQYRWGTGSTFFNPQKPKGKLAKSLSISKLRQIIHSRDILPPDVIVLEEGYISPSSYVNVKFVESLFRTPEGMNYFLNSSSKAKAVKETPDSTISIKDQTVFSVMKDLCLSLFHCDSPSKLNNGQKKELIRQLKRRLSIDPYQLERVTGISYEEISDALNAF